MNLSDVPRLLKNLIDAGTPAALVEQVTDMASRWAALVEKELTAIYDRRTADAARKRQSRHRADPPPAKPGRARKRATQWPDDFTPDLNYAVSKGLDPTRATQEAQRFHDYCAAHGSTYKDWPAAWRNWVTSPFQAKNGSAAHGKIQTLGDRARQLAAEARDRERAAGIDRPDESFGSGGSGRGDH